MENKSAYINVKNLTRLNNFMFDAINNPEKELNLTSIRNVSGLTVVNYKFYQDCMNNIENRLKDLEGHKDYDTFEEAVNSFKKAYTGREVYGNFYLLSHIGEVASRLSMLCYRGDEIGYERPDETIARSAKDVATSKEEGEEFSIIEPIYKEIVDTIKDNIKDITPENLPLDLKFYYDLVVNELKDFKVEY